jgi:hypothetical protein
MQYPKSEIFNIEQRGKYVLKAHVNILKKQDIKIFMDGKCRDTGAIVSW